MFIPFRTTTIQPLEYDLVRSHRRSLSLVVKPTGHVVIRAPLRMSKDKIDLFVQSKSRWLAKTLSQLQQHSKYKSQISHQEALGYHCLFGKWLKEDHSPSEDTKISLQTQFEEQVLQLLDSALLAYHLHDHHIQLEILFKTYKTRWGACKRLRQKTAGKLPDKATLMFNDKLRYLPLNLVNYVVIHETAHLFEPNHSSRFWDKVGEVLPEYKTLRKELKTYNIL